MRTRICMAYLAIGACLLFVAMLCREPLSVELYEWTGIDFGSHGPSNYEKRQQLLFEQEFSDAESR